MSIIMDTLGAIIIGSLLVLTIMTSIFKIGAISHDTNRLLNLARESEKVVKILSGTSLNNVGAGLDLGTSPIVTADPGAFVFRKRDAWNQPTDDVVRVSCGARTANGFPLTVTRNGQLETGPWWLADSLHIDYWRFDDHRIATPADSLDAIRSVSLNLAFAAPAYDQRQATGVVYRTVVWKYLLNMYF